MLLHTICSSTGVNIGVNIGVKFMFEHMDAVHDTYNQCPDAQTCISYFSSHLSSHPIMDAMHIVEHIIALYARPSI